MPTMLHVPAAASVPDLAAILKNAPEEFRPTMYLRWVKAGFNPTEMSVRLMNNHGFMTTPHSRFRLEQLHIGSNGTNKWVVVEIVEPALEKKE
jgi:hypothetical protein